MGLQQRQVRLLAGDRAVANPSGDTNSSAARTCCLEIINLNIRLY
jgi:hypothetical protein